MIRIPSHFPRSKRLQRILIGINLKRSPVEKETNATRKRVSDLMSLDIYLESLSKKEYNATTRQLAERNHTTSPLLSWEYFMESYTNTIHQIKLSKQLSALKSFALTHKWQDDFGALLAEKFDGLVLTNSELTIEWVDQGFSQMTGYSAKFAIGKTARFLQGKNTSETTRKRIRRHIQSGKPFRESIINYRKNQQEYRCELNVFPLRNAQGEVSHFLALETELK